MPIREEKEIFENYIWSRHLRHSEQRMQILNVFLKTEKHLTPEELHKLVKKKNPSIGAATVYRTLKLLRDSGLCRELQLGDGTVRYEHLYGHEHHDHLICVKCGTFTEVVDHEVERLQEKLAKKEGFTLQGHKLLMYGICRECK